MSKLIAVVAFLLVSLPTAREGFRSYQAGRLDEYEERVTGVTVPEFEGRTTSGELWRLSEERGQALLVNVWRSGCQPCRDTLPTIASLRSEFAGSAVGFVGIAFDRSGSVLDAFLEQEPISYPVVHDPSGAFWRLFGWPHQRPESMAWAASVPQTFLIDEAGVIAGVWTGAILPGSKREGEVRAAIRRLVAASIVPGPAAPEVGVHM